MAGSRRIVVEFLGKDTSASRTARSVDGTTSKLGATMSKVGRVAAVGLAAGTVLAGKALFDMGKAAAEDAQSQALLAKALQNSAGATTGQIKATEDWITAQGKALGVADDKLRPALSNLVRATGDVEKSQRLAALSMDVSAGSGKDLESISLAMAKAANGNVGALGRLGIATKNADGTTKSFAQIQKDLSKQFGGSAKASAETFAGKMGRLRLVLDEAKESIGAKLLPVAERLATWFVGSGLPAMERFGSWMRDNLGPIFQSIGDVVARITGGMNGDVSKNMAAITSTFRSVVSIWTSLWNRFGGTITAFLTTTFENIRTLIGGALQVISGVFKVFSSLLKGDWRGVWDGLKQIVSGALAIIKAVVSQALNVLRSAFRVAWSAIRGIVAGVWSGIKGLVAAGATSIVNTVKGIPARIKTLATAFKNAGKDLIQNFVNGLSNAGQFVSNIVGHVVDAVRGAINAALGKIESAISFKIDWPGPGSYSFNPSIPRLAEGGIVRARPGGTLALLGEAGADEAVVPLSGPHAPKGSAASGGVVININGALDPNAVAVQVRTMLLQLKRTTRTELGLA